MTRTFHICIYTHLYVCACAYVCVYGGGVLVECASVNVNPHVCVSVGSVLCV